MAKLAAQRFKEKALRELPSSVGVYALCDLDETPIYVGQSRDGIRARVRRHLTSARSDVIANRQVDVWEIAFVWAWPVAAKKHITPLEQHLFHQFNDDSPLVNGAIPPQPAASRLTLPERRCVQVMSDAEIEVRKDPALRFPRQIQHFNALVDYVLNTQDKPHLRRALEVYFNRLQRYYRQFIADS